MKISLKKFTEAVDQLKKNKIALKSDIADVMGYNRVNSLTEILGNRQKLNLEVLTKFCTHYGFNVLDFIEEEDEFTENHVVKEVFPEYQIDTIRSRVNEIEAQFDTIIKGQESLKQMMISGVDFMNTQTQNIKMLRKLVGA